jgi:hypothetical protein
MGVFAWKKGHVRLTFFKAIILDTFILQARIFSHIPAGI